MRPAQASALPRAPPLDIHKYSENGREYYAVNNGVAYPFPCDEVRMMPLLGHVFARS